LVLEKKPKEIMDSANRLKNLIRIIWKDIGYIEYKQIFKLLDTTTYTLEQVKMACEDLKKEFEKLDE
tara:strand:- start:1558 stop:1758 length:201 start_codon:yes stop_codon:yes gene_type:complete